jgi:hypothetical protein
VENRSEEKIIWVAHASRVLAKAFRFRELVFTLAKDCFGESPKPTRETRALPRMRDPLLQLN